MKFKFKLYDANKMIKVLDREVERLSGINGIIFQFIFLDDNNTAAFRKYLNKYLSDTKNMYNSKQYMMARNMLEELRFVTGLTEIIAGDKTNNKEGE